MPVIRTATPQDSERMAELLASGARRRHALDPDLWALLPDARQVIEAAVVASLGPQDGPANTLWRLAEDAGALAGVSHAMVVPVPPIYDVGPAPPGLLLDDCIVAPDAPAGTADALVEATEAGLKDAGAGAMIAACEAGSPLRAVYERHGYAPVTLYLSKRGFHASTTPAGVRAARPDEAAAIGRLGARHRQTLAQLAPLFWQIHPDADRRWELFVRYMMTLADREVLVAEAAGALQGYVVPQPISPLLIPAGHDIGRVGVIDDYYALDFAETDTFAGDGGAAANLLAAAESSFAARGVAAALVVCPAAWTSKLALLERAGWQSAKLWMFKP